MVALENETVVWQGGAVDEALANDAEDEATEAATDSCQGKQVL